MDDLISRQAAIDALCKSECGWNNAECRHKDDTDFCVTCDNVKIIKSLPSAQPERKAGHWILDRSGAYCCDNCMEPCAGYIMMKPRDKFCKMCGSRNEVME